MDRFFIERIKLRNIGPFADLDLSFRACPGITLICGNNGIGKSTILEGIIAPFDHASPQRLRKRAGSESGTFEIHALAKESVITGRGEILFFEPDAQKWQQVFPQHAKKVINIRAMRDFIYQRQETINRDPKMDDHAVATRVGAGLDASEIKKWFSNRFLLRSHAESGGWTSAMKKNLEVAIGLFSVVDPTVELQGVDVRSFDVHVSTPSGIVPFEYLSSGFKSAYALLLGIMKEIEYRGLDVAAADFTGVIVIDELDLHLHPTWQRQIVRILTEAFPSAQIIAATHSPHVVQAADADEVIALGRDEEGRVFRRPNPTTTYGYSGWTIDEVLEDVMGVPDTKSQEYRDAVARFDYALDVEDGAEITAALSVLREMLHPRSANRKLFEIQAAPFIGEGE